MSGYSTYMVGLDAYFDSDVLYQAGIQLGASVRRNHFLASWRVLHIDGFEQGFEIMQPLPARSGKTLQFYSPVFVADPAQVLKVTPFVSAKVQQ